MPVLTHLARPPPLQEQRLLCVPSGQFSNSIKPEIMATPKTTYQSKTGRSFPTAEEADRYDRLVESKEEYERARAKYARALAETNVTADGHQFELTTLHTYYFVVEPHGWSQPHLGEVSFYLWHCDVDGSNQGVILVKRDDGEGYTTYRISELYYYESAAKAKMAESMEQFISWMQEDLEKLKS